jgi:DNA transformation protein
MEKLSAIGDIAVKKMFGGYGVFHGGKMFGIVDPQGQCYLKTDDSNRTDFEVYNSDKHSRIPYFSIPEEIFNDTKELITWAKKSIDMSK